MYVFWGPMTIISLSMFFVWMAAVMTGLPTTNSGYYKSVHIPLGNPSHHVNIQPPPANIKIYVGDQSQVRRQI